MDDFAHHPTAVKKTIQAIKGYYRDNRLVAVFEPRTNTSMRNIFQNVYTEAFDSADRVCIRKPALLEKIPHFFEDLLLQENAMDLFVSQTHGIQKRYLQYILEGKQKQTQLRRCNKIISDLKAMKSKE